MTKDMHSAHIARVVSNNLRDGDFVFGTIVDTMEIINKQMLKDMAEQNNYSNITVQLPFGYNLNVFYETVIRYYKNRGYVVKDISSITTAQDLIHIKMTISW